jgi:hypothetical protein
MMRQDGEMRNRTADNWTTWNDETPAMTLARGSAPEIRKKGLLTLYCRRAQHTARGPNVARGSSLSGPQLS